MSRAPTALTVAIADRCTACGLCLATCPAAVLERAPKRPHVRVGRCTGCLDCVDVCPVDAITVTAVTA